MSFIDDPRIYGRMPTANDPILLNQPRSARALQRKSETVYPLLADINPTVARSLMDLDAQRVSRGQQPMSDKQTIDAALAAIPKPGEQFGRTVQPVQERETGLLDIPGNAISDLRDVFTSIPKLPLLLAQQIKDIPSIPDKLNDALSSGNLQNLQQVPIVNLVPGAYTATNVLSGNADEILKHPLFTALDVAPFAKAKVFKAPASMLEADGSLINRSLYDQAFPKMRTDVYDAQKALGINRLGETQMVSAADLAKNTPFGQKYQAAVDEAKFKIRGSKIGEAYQSRIGGELRDVVAVVNQTQRTVYNDLSRYGGVFDTEVGPNAARNRQFLGRFNPDAAWREVSTKFDDAFDNNEAWIQQHYGTPEDWAKRRVELSAIAEERPVGNNLSDPVIKRSSLPAHEQDYLNGYKEVTRAMAEPFTSPATAVRRQETPFMEVEFVTPSGNPIKELLPYNRGLEVMRARRAKLVTEEHLFINNVLNDPQFRATVTPQDLMQRSIDSPTLNSDFGRKAQLTVMEGYANAYLALGVDARPFLKRVKANRYKNQLPAPVITAASNFQAMLPNAPVLTVEEIRATLQPQKIGRSGKPYTPGIHPELYPLKALIDGNADLLAIRNAFVKVHPKIVGDMSVPSEFRSLNPAQVVESLQTLNLRKSWVKNARREGYDPTKLSYKSVVNAGKIVAKKERQAVPARMVPQMETLVRQGLRDEAEKLGTAITNGSPEAIDKMVELVGQGEYHHLDTLIDEAGASGSAAKMYTNLRDDVAGSWMELIDKGADPLFVHHVGVGKGGKAYYPRITLDASPPTAFKERTLDFRPSEGDLALALKHQGMEILVKRGEDHVIDVMFHGQKSDGINAIARSKSELQDLFRDRIDREYARAGKGIDRQTIADNFITKYYAKMDRSQYLNYKGQDMYPSGVKMRGSQRGSAAKASQEMYVPKNVARMLDDLSKPLKPNAVWDPVMGVFRTTTLLLSPRWQIYNVLGNGLLASLESGTGWMKHFPEAWKNAKLIREGSAPSVDVPWNVRASMGQNAAEQAMFMDISKEGLGSVRNAVADKLPAVADLAGRWGKPIGKGFDKITDFSVRLNAAVDDATRIAGYMSTLDKSVGAITPEISRFLSKDGLYQTASGATDTLAMRRVMAETSMRRWAYNWDMMSPWERSVARFVFPFYGFFSHMMRYAFRYGAEHPTRAALTAAFARSELQDWGTALPQRIHNLFIAGKEDEQGNRKAINFAGWNPFVDTANLFTLTGWMGQVNPMLSTLAEQFGVDPRTGEASLYPSAEFDEKTGRLVLKKRGLAQSLVENVIPQSQVVTNLLGVNPQFNELARTNRGAANRLVGSALGIPTLVRPVNVTQEITKTELARENAGRQALSEAVRQASTDPVRAYPALVEQVNTLLAQREQDPEQFAKFTPVNAAPSTFDLLTGSLQAWKE